MAGTPKVMDLTYLTVSISKEAVDCVVGFELNVYW